MVEKTTSNTTLGLELTLSELRGALLAYKQNRPTLERIFKIPIDQEHLAHPVKLLYTEKEEKELFLLSHKSLTVSAITSSDVLIRDLEVLLSKEKDIDQVLDFQTEPLLPYPIEEAIVDRIFIKKSNEKTLLTIASVKKEHLQAHLEHWHAIKVEPEVVSCIPAALAAFSEQFMLHEEPYFALHLGEFESSCCLIQKGALLSTQAYKWGTHNLKSAFEEDVKTKEKISQTEDEDFYTLDYTNISKTAFPSLFETIQLYRQETTKIFFYLAKQAPKKELFDVFVVGEGAILKNFGESLCSHLKKTLHFPQPSPQFSISQEELSLFAVPIGAALTALPKAPYQINFRQKEFIYPYPWKRLKKPIILYFILSIFLAIGIYLFGFAYIGKQEDNLKKNYLNLLVLMNKSFDEFEQDIQKREPSIFSQKKITPSFLTQEDIRKRLSLLEKEIRESPDIFPLLPNIPRVSDVLAWLSSHPHIKGEEDSSTEGSRLQLENFNYKMIKRPEANKMKEKYQVKVDIEFTAQTPRYAREFHDILLAPNDIIDPNSDINWSTERGKYRASFFLKDKTLYPTSKSIIP